MPPYSCHHICAKRVTPDIFRYRYITILVRKSLRLDSGEKELLCVSQYIPTKYNLANRNSSHRSTPFEVYICQIYVLIDTYVLFGHNLVSFQYGRVDIGVHLIWQRRSLYFLWTLVKHLWNVYHCPKCICTVYYIYVHWSMTYWHVATLSRRGTG